VALTATQVTISRARCQIQGPYRQRSSRGLPSDYLRDRVDAQDLRRVASFLDAPLAFSGTLNVRSAHDGLVVAEELADRGCEPRRVLSCWWEAREALTAARSAALLTKLIESRLSFTPGGRIPAGLGALKGIL
jgi:hypothetical protein